MNKQGLQPQNGMLFSNKKECTTATGYNMNETQKQYENYTVHDSIYMKYAEKTNL